MHRANLFVFTFHGLLLIDGYAPLSAQVPRVPVAHAAQETAMAGTLYYLQAPVAMFRPKRRGSRSLLTAPEATIGQLTQPSLPTDVSSRSSHTTATWSLTTRTPFKTCLCMTAKPGKQREFPWRRMGWKAMSIQAVDTSRRTDSLCRSSQAAPPLFQAIRMAWVMYSCMTGRPGIGISVASDGSEGNGWSYSVLISGNGRSIAFVSYATNFDANDTNEGLVYLCMIWKALRRNPTLQLPTVIWPLRHVRLG